MEYMLKGNTCSNYSIFVLEYEASGALAQLIERLYSTPL